MQQRKQMFCIIVESHSELIDIQIFFQHRKGFILILVYNRKVWSNHFVKKTDFQLNVSSVLFMSFALLLYRNFPNSLNNQSY